ncbi:hypothetical protein MLD38_001802 [Melastoma candidum]|uniref:Uncharacterized protein n=1 Tax=Melastoma candidum TaxID=119954 RepID=A0ACB9SGD4_9MYRT|nr:hypothetical protein MLD38_001802 [Melastoma candidum]
MPAPSPVSDNLVRTFTATKEMAQDAVNAATPKAGEVARVVKDTAKSAAIAIAPTVKDAAESTKEITGSWVSWFRHKIGNLGIIQRGPAAETAKRSSSPSPAYSPAPAPVKFPRTP